MKSYLCLLFEDFSWQLSDSSSLEFLSQIYKISFFGNYFSSLSLALWTLIPFLFMTSTGEKNTWFHFRFIFLHQLNRCMNARLSVMQNSDFKTFFSWNFYMLTLLLGSSNQQWHTVVFSSRKNNSEHPKAESVLQSKKKNDRQNIGVLLKPAFFKDQA